MSYTQRHVERARNAYRTGEKAVWRLGEVLVEAFPTRCGGSVGHGAASFEREVEQFGQEAGIPHSVRTLIEYRATVKAWPPEARKDACFAAHKVLRSNQHLLEDGMTTQDALAVLGRGGEQLRPGSRFTPAEGISAATRFLISAIDRLTPASEAEITVLGERISVMEKALDALCERFDTLAILREEC